MLEIPFGSSAYAILVSALRVFSSHRGVKDALTVIVSAIEKQTWRNNMAAARVDSTWLKRRSVAHGGEVDVCVLGASAPGLPCHVQVRSCGYAASGDAEFHGEQ